MEANDDPTINMAFAVGRTPFIVNLIPCEDSASAWPLALQPSRCLTCCLPVAFPVASLLLVLLTAECWPGWRARRAAMPCSRCRAS
ncbi:hypothetical protein E2C01_054146 [Portunus trituberculatus]|uniref:Uncharacterized protein n=1 Tax=Portunus trituberculatus TaxID=210409 RepID=A0A5B7GII1_PORTR|nr:hypothetical protein [Portunus trituberculatus]